MLMASSGASEDGFCFTQPTTEEAVPFTQPEPASSMERLCLVDPSGDLQFSLPAEGAKILGSSRDTATMGAQQQKRYSARQPDFDVGQGLRHISSQHIKVEVAEGGGDIYLRDASP